MPSQFAFAPGVYVQGLPFNFVLAGGNPLLDPEGGDFAVKRRWDEDVVFRNQARQEPRKQRRFINDTVRNDFHKRFLNRYIR